MVYEIHIGNVLDKIKEIESETVDCVITSPPYYGLRNYGTTEWQIGLEETPELYIQKMVEVFREIHRVLKPTGTVWLNIGDSYWGGKGKSNQNSPKDQEKRQNSKNKGYHQVAGKGKTRPTDKSHDIFKPKDLMLIPHRLAIALQNDGWYLRQDIIWYKTNPMPESVKDRCTKSHEHIFMLTKSKMYYFNHEENRVASTDKNSKTKAKRNRHDVWILGTKPYKEAHFAVYPPDLIEPCVLTGCPPNGVILDPFAGSGTTGGVAEKHGRNSILIELNPEYAKLIPERISSISLKV